MERFCNELGVDAGEEDELEAKQQKPSKPADYQALFGANNNDHFMVGIKITRYVLSLSIAVIIFVPATPLLLSKVFLGGVFRLYKPISIKKDKLCLDIRHLLGFGAK